MPRPIVEIEGPAMGYEVLPHPDLKFSSIQSTPKEIMMGNVPAVGDDLVGLLRRSDHLSTWNTSVRCHSEGVVKRSVFGWASITATPTTADLERVRDSVYHLARLLFEAGAVAVFPGINGIPRTLKSLEETRAIQSAELDPRNYALNCSHLFGTCRMASSAADGVVDPWFRTHEAEALYVIDASVFPSGIGTNPQEAIMTLARHAARALAA